MIVLINILLILNTVESLNLMYEGVCEDRSGRLFCCFNYVEVNGVCIECMNGFMTFDGGQCRPCSRGFYGKDCLITCHCNMNEKCDHVKGCLKVLHSTTEVVTEHDHVEGTTFSEVEPTTNTHRKRGKMIVRRPKYAAQLLFDLHHL
ncbi:angiopoietin-1 receptor-like [Mytilus edulis]|uniref:angiopoietin-1 receptor-like n=1 Tax=Mytilus edulis TaxID=6550 RepID=UPI0039EF64FD